jgi:hypothetical protein
MSAARLTISTGYSGRSSDLDIGFSVRFGDLPRRGLQGGEQRGISLFHAPRSEYSLEQRREMAISLRQAYDPPNGFAEG